MLPLPDHPDLHCYDFIFPLQLPPVCLVPPGCQSRIFCSLLSTWEFSERVRRLSCFSSSIKKFLFTPIFLWTETQHSSLEKSLGLNTAILRKKNLYLHYETPAHFPLLLREIKKGLGDIWGFEDYLGFLNEVEFHSLCWSFKIIKELLFLPLC